MKKVTLTTSSALSGGIDRVGWAYILRYGNHSREDARGAAITDILRYGSHSAENTEYPANKALIRMEMLAMEKGLQKLKEPCEVLLISEYRHLLEDFSFWRFKWKAHGWAYRDRKNKKILLLNADLWQRLDAAAEKHIIHTQPIEEQSGDPDMKRCDHLARSQASRYDLLRTEPNMKSLLG